MAKYRDPRAQDSYYGEHPLEPDIDMTELKHLCSEYIQRFKVSIIEAKDIAERTADQSADVTGEWQLQITETWQINSFHVW